MITIKNWKGEAVGFLCQTSLAAYLAGPGAMLRAHRVNVHMALPFAFTLFVRLRRVFCISELLLSPWWQSLLQLLRQSPWLQWRRALAVAARWLFFLRRATKQMRPTARVHILFFYLHQTEQMMAASSLPHPSNTHTRHLFTPNTPLQYLVPQQTSQVIASPLIYPGFVCMRKILFLHLLAFEVGHFGLWCRWHKKASA